MKRWLTTLCLGLLTLAAPAQALKSQLIEIDLGREYGFFNKSATKLRAVTIASQTMPTKTALLFFVGWPGILWIPENLQPERMVQNSANSRLYITRHIDFFPSQGITLVMVDCPTDQWGNSVRSRDPQGCGDSYRSSTQHRDDVLKLMAHLREKEGIEKFFLLGHSYGSVSSRWLAVHLGDQIQGSIHSASMTEMASTHPRLADYGSSVSRLDLSQARAPLVFVHNEQDQCHSTKFAPNQVTAQGRLITVKGGAPEGDPCGGGHYHSYQGRELVVLQAMAKWILTGEITPVVGQ